MILETLKISTKLFSVAAILICLFAPLARAESSSSPVVIHQLQTSSSSSTSQEYVSIYNNSAQPVDVTNWCLVYSSASDVSQTQLSCLAPPNALTKLWLPSHQSLTFSTLEFRQASPSTQTDYSFSASIATASGHIKLIDSNKQVIDILGWGAATAPEAKTATAHAAGKILQRKALTEGAMQDTNNNYDDFQQADPVYVSTGHLYEEVIEPTCPEFNPQCATNHPVISEIFANAEGADAGKEFIELHNDTDFTVSLKGYSLLLGPSFTKSYSLPDGELAWDSYVSFLDTQSGLVLPNGGGTIRLADPLGQIVSEITYGEVEETASWALIGDSWTQTFKPTPGALNETLAYKPCKVGYLFDEATSSCKAATLVTVPAPCKPNQTRNIETGRCRNNPIVAAATVCKIGQTKNPETNRCRNIQTATGTKECPQGQVRNTETNRCRKVVAATANAKVTDVPTPLVKNTAKWWVAGIGALSAAGYAIFEWRREVFGVLEIVKGKFLPA